MQVKSLPATKRSLLNVIGRIFDPLGLLSLFVIRWKIPQCYFLNGLSRAIQLHCFSDASRNAYAAAVYIRSCYADGFIDMNLVIAKTILAPLHQQNIPRLEVLGTNILSCLSANVNNALSLPDGIMVFYWIDYMTVLYWIKNNKPWRQYVMS